MKRNVASQKIGAQLITAADGSNFTGAVTVEVTLDAGTQATGSVGSGACVHEGNGYHTYAPAQAETNGDLIAFTFHGTGAISVTVQVYTDTIMTTAMTESYAADGATVTPAQVLYMILAILTEASVVGTTLTAKKLDGATTAGTFTINSATAPTSITRAT